MGSASSVEADAGSIVVMKADNISRIEIDDLDRLRIRPEKERFEYIWRSATEVHWDKEGFLYSPKPREWSYYDWYKHIVDVIKVDGYCELKLTDQTTWVNISPELKAQIESY